MKKLVSICIFAFTLSASAQNTPGNVTILDRDMFILNWEVAIPTNSDFLSKTSFINWRAEYRHLITNEFAFGVSIGWNSFEEKVDQQLFEEEDGSTAVFTDLVRQVYQIPFSANGYYYFGGTEEFRPYAGLGLGANYSQQEAYFNVFVIEDTNWGFYLRPEIGAQYLFDSGFGFIGYLSYNYATNSSEFFDVDNLSHVGIGLGVTWAW
jgi:outer membrane protein W